MKHESAIITNSTTDSLDARSELFGLMQNYPGTPEEMERSLGLFIRGSLMARIFAIRELYEKIVMFPGMVIDMGTWRGQTAVVCENLRAIFEPLHFNRRIAAFDTFEGYKGFSEKDKATQLHSEGTYALGEGYEDLLAHLLSLHERNNALGHNHGKHFVVKGDCRETLPAFFRERPNEVVALSFFDINAYEPTLDAFNLIWERTVPGGIVAFWQLTQKAIQAEGKLYNDHILNRLPHRLQRSQFYPGLCHLVKS